MELPYLLLIGSQLPLLAGWLLDRRFGDPAGVPHPVVGFGKLIAAGERRWNRGAHRMLKGGLLAVGLVAGTWMTTKAIIGLLWLGNLLALLFEWGPGAWISLILVILFETAAVFYSLAGKTLIDEVREVFRAVDRSTETGRRQVARIVGRDTAALSPQEIRTAALETLAENLNDGVVAPIFWYALLGVPGMAAYKMVNTLDSMIGYRTERYRRFGCAAARIDDAANWIPARLTALSMLLAAGRPRLMRFVLRFGPQHASPNSGWPEAALAGILDCRFGGPHDYFGETVCKPYIGTNDRPLTTADMQRAIVINRRVEIVCIVLAIGFRTLLCDGIFSI